MAEKGISCRLNRRDCETDTLLLLINWIALQNQEDYHEVPGSESMLLVLLLCEDYEEQAEGEGSKREMNAARSIDRFPSSCKKKLILSMLSVVANSLRTSASCYILIDV